jgi:hypothetical protein
MEKYGFVYIWYDRKHKRYYVGCHWGTTDDGYICSSTWMKKAYKNRPKDFRRRVLKSNIQVRADMYLEEQRYLDMIKKNEIKPENPKPRYYNINLNVGNLWHKYPEHIKTVGAKISASKTGKNTGPRDSSVGEKISAAKKQKRLEKESAGLPLYNMSDKVRAANAAKIGKTHSDEHKTKISTRMKEHYADNPKEKVQPKQRMTLEDQSKLCSIHLSARWSDPVWAENQKNALKQSWVKRREKLNNNELTH